MSWGNGESTLRSSNEKPWLWPAILSTKSQIARELGINASLLGRWNRELKEGGGSCSRGGLNAVPPSDYGDMSTSVLRGIILLLGGVICVLSTYGAFAPFKLTNWVRSAWGKKPTFPFTVIVRLVMGSMLIFAAPESRFPGFL